jgi:hypothetical protein
MTIKCEICNINNAQVKDYRKTETDCYTKYLVCSNCFMLNDKWFFKLKYAKKTSRGKIIKRISKDYIIK